MSASERFLRLSHHRAAALEAESARFREVTPEFGYFVARISRKASDEIETANNSFGSEGKGAFSVAMNSYVRRNIILPSDNIDPFPPRYSFRYSDNHKAQFHIVEFSYEPGDKSNQRGLRKAAEVVHEGLQKNELEKGSYEVDAGIGWDNYADFMKDAGKLYGMDSLHLTMNDNASGNLSLATESRVIRYRKQYSSKLDVITTGAMRRHLPNLLTVLQPTHVLLDLPHDTHLKSRVMEMVRQRVVIDHPDFSFGDHSDQWGDYRYLLPTKYLTQAQSLANNSLFDPESDDRLIGIVNVYDGSEHAQFAKRVRDIRSIIEVIGEPSGSFDASGSCPRQDVSDYARYLPENSHVRSISLRAGKKPKGHNKLFVGSRLEIDCDLNNNSLHHLQSQAARAAGIQFVA